MKNCDKHDLKEIVMKIPESELNEKVSVLWKRYAQWEFSYQTFRKYLIAFRKR